MNIMIFLFDILMLTMSFKLLYSSVQWSDFKNAIISLIN